VVILAINDKLIGLEFKVNEVNAKRMMISAVMKTMA